MTTLKSAAEKYGKDVGYLDSPIMYQRAFLAGASFREKQILEILKEADVSTDWLIDELKEMDKEK